MAVRTSPTRAMPEGLSVRLARDAPPISPSSRMMAKGAPEGLGEAPTLRLGEGDRAMGAEG